MVWIIFFMWPSCMASTLECRREGWRWRRWRGSRRTSRWEGWCLPRWPARRRNVPAWAKFYIKQLVICEAHSQPARRGQASSGQGRYWLWSPNQSEGGRELSTSSWFSFPSKCLSRSSEPAQHWAFHRRCPNFSVLTRLPLLRTTVLSRKWQILQSGPNSARVFQ